jgi:hypothetical protein
MESKAKLWVVVLPRFVHAKQFPLRSKTLLGDAGESAERFCVGNGVRAKRSGACRGGATGSSRKTRSNSCF